MPKLCMQFKACDFISLCEGYSVYLQFSIPVANGNGGVARDLPSWVPPYLFIILTIVQMLGQHSCFLPVYTTYLVQYSTVQ